MKFIVLLVVLGSVALFMAAANTTLVAWWDRRIHTYATWMAAEFESMLESMSVDKAKQYITAMVGGAFAAGFLLGGTLLARVVFGLIFAFGGWFLPWLFVVWRRKKRLDTIDDQLVDSLLMMANALKSGLSLQQALELVTREMKPPISDEFARIVKEIHLGRLTDDALRRFGERVPLDDVRLTVDSILALRETGGNLSETFQVIAKTVVERKKVQGKIKAMTAQGMSQGVIISAMPIVLMLLFSLIDANYMRPFFNTAIGWMMMLLMFVLDGLGLWLMVKLVQVEV